MTDPALRVIHFHFGKEGGAERFFVKLAQALDRRGVEQRFIIRPNRSWDAGIAPLGRVIRNNFRVTSLLTPVLHWQADRWVKEWKPHAVMSWMPRAARLVHKWPGVVKLNRMGDFPQNLKHFENCDLLVGNVPGIAQTCRKLGWTKPAITISNFTPIVTPVPVPRAAHATPEDAFLVAAGGRFQPRKALDTAIRAIARISGAWLWLIGDGRLRPELEKLAAELGVTDRIRFVGWVENPVHHIASADAFLLPSRHEPLGNILLEAWAANVPSVSTRSDGPSWFMRDGIDGLMADIDNVDQIAAALTTLRDNPVAARALAANARARLDEFFSEEAICNDYMRVFRGDF
ncbi:glycosyltransferase [Albidovulum sp.]|uniref:glycosyltransferase n=1 Tax=Albidovulum sp. TaxID=1872424 RepID=UPI0039B8FE23